MTTPRHGRQYHPFYSAHADPTENMLRAQTLKAKSSYNISAHRAAARSPACTDHGRRDVCTVPCTVRSTREQSLRIAFSRSFVIG